MQKDVLNVHVSQNRNCGPFHRKDFMRKKYGGLGLVSEKMVALFAELNERVEAASSSYSAKGKFLQHVYSMFVVKNHQKI